MNEAQVCLIKSGSSIAKIHSHMARKSVKCVLSMSGPLECCCTFKGQLINGYFIGVICSPHKCCQIRDDVCSHQLGYNNISTAKTIKSPLLTSSLNLNPPPQRVSQRTPGHVLHCLSFHLEEGILIPPVGPAATEARWFSDEAQQSCLNPPSGPGSFGNAPPAHIVLHLPP